MKRRLPRKIKKYIKKDNCIKILDKDSLQAVVNVCLMFKVKK